MEKKKRSTEDITAIQEAILNFRDEVVQENKIMGKNCTVWRKIVSSLNFTVTPNALYTVFFNKVIFRILLCFCYS